MKKETHWNTLPSNMYATVNDIHFPMYNQPCKNKWKIGTKTVYSMLQILCDTYKPTQEFG